MKKVPLDKIHDKLQELLWSFDQYDDNADVPSPPDGDEYTTSVPIGGPGGAPQAYGSGIGDDASDNRAREQVVKIKRKGREFVEEPPTLGTIDIKELRKNPASNRSRKFKLDADTSTGKIKIEQVAKKDPNDDVAAAMDPGAQTDPNAMGGGMDPNAGMGGGDPNAMGGGMGGDPNAMGGGGMGGGEEPFNVQEIGRIFELKKIYARLISIESFLTFSSDDILQKLKLYVTKAIELFQTLSSNIKSFKDQLDDIIVTYYEFLEEIHEILKEYYEVEMVKKDKEKKEESLDGKQVKDVGDLNKTYNY